MLESLTALSVIPHVSRYEDLPDTVLCDFLDSEAYESKTVVILDAVDWIVRK